MKNIFISSVVLLGIYAYAPIALAATSTNLILNPSVETASANVNAPLSWNIGSWGTNDAAFTYPVLGYDGARAVEVHISTYADGDAKWYANEVSVSSGTTYTFSDVYRSDATSSVVIRYTLNSGGVIYQDLITEVPSSAAWKSLSKNFTVPVGVRSVSVWHLLNHTGTLTTDLYGIIDPSVSTVDTLPPTVSLTAPTSGATVAGTVSLLATATDNVGVLNVDFFVDGTLLSEDASSPYQASWNTTSSANGAHTLFALARDTSGNTATSSQVTVMVSNNIATSTRMNLISNPSLKTFGADGQPIDWARGNWGTNNALFSYTSTSSDGAASGRIDMTSYINGDAKWYFKNVPVATNTLYAFSDFYQASVRTAVVIRYTMADGSFRYIDLPNAAASPTWKEYTASFTVPQGVTSLTIFHLIAQTGYLAVDSYALVQGNGILTDPELFAQGMVSLTFDDGWISHYTDALPILNTASLKGVFAIISQETIQALSGNIIANPSFETSVTGSSSQPVGWSFATSGSNNAIGNYPIVGQSGARGAGIIISIYQSGDASWVFDETSVIPNQNYSYSEFYNSTATTTTMLRVHLNNDTFVTTVLDTLPATTSWAKYAKVFNVPANALALTIFHRLAASGTLAIDNTDLERVQVYVDPTMVRAMQAGGHEIASHTQHHPSLVSVSTSTLLTEINNSKTDLLGIGVNVVQSLFYPYGDFNAGVEREVKNAGYLGASSVVL